MKVLIDASSIAPLFLPDEDSLTVEQYLDEAEIIAAPKLAIVETAAAFFRRSRKGSLTVRQAQAAAGAWMQTVQSGSVTFYEDAEVLSEACATAGHLNHALQDCIYLELARKLKYTLVTGDRVFAKKGASLYPDILTV
jgi:predicted nucleic acid-binding protein